MKMLLFLFSALLALFAVNAQDGPCPTNVRLQLLQDPCEANNVVIEVRLLNNSQNLYGFNMEIVKPELANWVTVDENENPNCIYYTGKGYAHNILAQWEGVTDEEREEQLSQHCDILSQMKGNGNLLILEVLSNNDCRFFPTSDENSAEWDDYFIPVGKFAIDVSNLDDYNFMVSTSDRYFNFVGGPEGTCAWNSDYYESLGLYKIGDYVSAYWQLPPGFDAIDEVDATKSISSVKYYNLAGVESAELQQGVNIKVTTYTDGTRSSEKVIK